MNRKSDSSEKDRMKRLIICKLCHETLEEPIILPCGKTICSKHLLDEANNFKCDLCYDSHDKTVDNFPVNEALNELVQISDDYVDLNSIDLGPEYKLAKEQCKHLKDLINESELLTKDPSFYINDYFTNLRNEIDLFKEKLIEDIRDKHEQLIDKIKEIETKCEQNIQNKESKILDHTIKSTKEKLNKWTELLESNLNRGVCCTNVVINSQLSISELKYEMNKCKVALLKKKVYKFNSIQIDDPIFGDLVTKEAEIIDENRLEGTIRFEIKDFSKFRFTFNKTQLIDQWFVVNNIPWKIGLQMNEKDNDIYLEILYKPCTKQFLEFNPIKTDISLKFIKKNGESYVQKNFIKLFDDNRAHRLAKLISLKDIMNQSNSLFNKQTDTVTIEARIKIID